MSNRTTANPRGRRGADGPLGVGLADDWETDPDFIHDIDEIEQRWGSRRTVGSVNMSKLIDEVRQDHKTLREKFDHPSQRDYSEGFGGKFGVQRDRQDPSAMDYNYHEKLSKHTSQEISRKVVSTTGGTDPRDTITEARRAFMRNDTPYDATEPATHPKSRAWAPTTTTTTTATGASSTRADEPQPRRTYTTNIDTTTTTGAGAPRRSPAYEESSTRRVVHEESSSTSSTGGPRRPADMPPTMRSIQEKIDAFKREFDDIDKTRDRVGNFQSTNKVSKNFERTSSASNREEPPRQPSASGPPNRPSSTSPRQGNIKSLSEKFETLCREERDEFHRQSQERRKEFFDQIKTQVRDTRKGLDGFGPIDENDDDDDNDYNERERKTRSERFETQKSSASSSFASRPPYSPTAADSSPSPRLASRLSGGSPSSLGKPKVYTTHETSREEVVTKVVKENDKIVENETKRNVERSSSRHGSSDEEPEEGGGANEPGSIKYIEQTMRSSPTFARPESPVDRVKRNVPLVEPKIKGAGLMARTLYDYQANESDELTFDVDDLITNIEKIDPGWYKGIIVYKDGTKREGLFPSNYVTLLNDH